MEKVIQSPSILADQKRLLWVQTQWNMFIEESDHQLINGEVIQLFLDGLILNKVHKPDMFTLWSSAIRRAIEESQGQPVTSQGALVIRRWANYHARQVASGRLYEPTQATAITPTELAELVGFLWRRKWTNLSFKESALAAYIASHTGARMNEVVNIYLEDIQPKEDGNTKFLRMPLRSSKSNAFKTRREALVLPIPKDTTFPVEHWIKVIRSGRKSGKLFQLATSAKVRSHFKIVATGLGWGSAPTCHSLRAHFVVQSLASGASEMDIIMCCRWKDDTMINTYRATQMECTEKGPAFRIFSLKKQNGLVLENVPKIIKKRKLEDTHPNPVVDLTMAPSETKPALSLQNTGTNQLRIVIPRIKAHASTQTENVEFELENSARNVLSEESLKSWQEYLKL